MIETNEIVQLKSVMMNAGLNCPATIIPNGCIHRFANPGDKSKPCWYVMRIYANNLVIAAFGCFKRDISKKWINKNEKTLSEQDKKLIIEMQGQLEKEWQERKAKAKQIAQSIWNKSSLCPVNFSYLASKKINSYNVRLHKGNMIIPMYDENQELCSLQFISPVGGKLFLKDAPTKGCFLIIGEIKDKIYLCEGYATAATVHEATGEAVIVAFSAHNILPVANILRAKYPKHEITICADNDAFSLHSNFGVQKSTGAALAINAKLAIPQFKNLETKPTDFNDLFQLEEMDEVKKQLSTANFVHEDRTIPEGFSINNDGVYFEIRKSNGEISEKIFVCSKIDIIARTRDSYGLNHGRLLEFKDTDGRVHQWAMPMDILGGDATDCRRNLLNMGAILDPSRKARDKLIDYLLNSSPRETALCVGCIGWYNKTFIFPDKAIGESDSEKIIYQSTSIDIAGFKVKGSLQDWIANVSAYCIGNSRLVLIISTALATTMIRPLGEESGGFHITGVSSGGKTTTLKLGCSVWGEQERLQNWRATSNGLEAIAALHNDSLLCLDELSQVDPKEAGEIAYMLANGSGKNRSKKDGSLQRRQAWKLLFVSSGEIDLTEHISQVGKKIKAGQQVRLLNIPADAGKGFGIFEDLHDFTSGADFARYLDQATKSFYGAPIREFLQRVTENGLEATATKIKELSQIIFEKFSISETDGQVKRAARRFALIAATGELATEFGITGWSNGEATRAIIKCFRDWIKSRGGTNSQEELQAKSQIRAFFQKNYPSRFCDWKDSSNTKIINKVGFVRKISINGSDGLGFFVETEIFKNEICQGLNCRQAIKICINEGWLIPDNENKASSSHRAPDTDKVRRFYHFSDKVLGGENEE